MSTKKKATEVKASASSTAAGGASPAAVSGGEIAAAAAAASTNNSDQVSPYQSIDPSMSTPSFLFSLKSHVKSQIASRLEYYTALYGPNNSASRTMLTFATRDFPFLGSVDWGAERAGMMEGGGYTEMDVDGGGMNDSDIDGARDQYSYLHAMNRTRDVSIPSTSSSPARRKEPFPMTPAAAAEGMSAKSKKSLSSKQNNSIAKSPTKSASKSEAVESFIDKMDTFVESRKASPKKSRGKASSRKEKSSSTDSHDENITVAKTKSPTKPASKSDAIDSFIESRRRIPTKTSNQTVGSAKADVGNDSMNIPLPNYDTNETPLAPALPPMDMAYVDVEENENEEGGGDNEPTADGKVEARSGVTIDNFVPNGKVEEKWFHNFKKWVYLNNPSSPDTFGFDPLSSILPKEWAKTQRGYYKEFEQGNKSPMTQDKVTLLEAAGFELVGKRGRKSSVVDEPNGRSTNNDTPKTASARVGTSPSPTNASPVERTSLQSKDDEIRQISRSTKRKAPSALELPLPAMAKKRKSSMPQSESEESYQQNDSDSGVDQPASKPKPKKSISPRKMYFSFDERLQQCIAFKEEHGHMHIQNNAGILENRLGEWACAMKTSYRKLFNGDASPTEVHVESDVTIESFVPNGKVENKWFGNLKQWIAEQQSSNGDTNDSSSSASPLPKQWGKKQRDYYRLFSTNQKSQLTSDMVALLNDAGFFSSKDAQYQRKGVMATGSEYIQLEMLEEIGFAFDPGENNDGAGAVQDTSTPNGRVWNWRLEQCRQYNEENGHLNIPKHDKVLGKWADRMCDLYNRRLVTGKKTKKTSLLPISSAERVKVKELEKLGFAFDGTFDVHMQRLAAFKAEAGHTKVPLKYHLNRALGHWVEMIRREHNKANKGEQSDYLTVDRLRKLATIGFSFEARKADHGPWEGRFEQLRAYREEHGCDPPTSHKELGNWINSMRKYYNHKQDGKKHHLTDEREEKLRSIGFVFQKGNRPSAAAKASIRSGQKKTFDDRLAEFARWKELHGHPYVPTVQEGEYKHLGRWVAKCRMAYKAYKKGVRNPKFGILTADQALKLANAGFAFDASHIHKTPKNNNPDVSAAAAEEEEEEEDEAANRDGHEAGWDSYGQNGQNSSFV